VGLQSLLGFQAKLQSLVEQKQKGDEMSKKKNLQIKVWAEIEVLDLDTDETEDVGLPVCLGTFSTVEDAQAFLSNLETTYEGEPA
jgi:hypothetical protein